MIHGNPMDGVIAVEADDAWTFASEMNGILQQEPLFYVDATHVDAHKFKAILLKREINNEADSAS